MDDNDILIDLPIDHGTITKIERQKRAKDRYNLFIDEQFVFSIHEDVLIKYRLAKGSVINGEEMLLIVQAQDRQQAYLDAIRLLSFRLRSEYELKVRLKQKNYEPPTIEDTIDRLRREQYIDDSLFAEQLTEQRIHSHKKGRNWIKQELQQKGLRKEHITKALEQIDEVTEYTNAFTLIHKKYGASLSPDTDVRNIQRKAISLLQRRGYSFSVVSRVMRKFSQIIGSDQDMEEIELDFGEQ
ncbi:recombinase RecX [Paenibacillus sp. S3N08]|uniref:Regulatory protein RecX n=2 Tax=Paenibacillus agricola TaxID=2716264 RepID=A0ABX0IYU9_9BACL|nr:recombinase RecX [Paenibacillus agricola]